MTSLFVFIGPPLVVSVVGVAFMSQTEDDAGFYVSVGEFLSAHAYEAVTGPFHGLGLHRTQDDYSVHSDGRPFDGGDRSLPTKQPTCDDVFAPPRPMYLVAGGSPSR
jgi:hypothetical protein